MRKTCSNCQHAGSNQPKRKVPNDACLYPNRFDTRYFTANRCQFWKEIKDPTEAEAKKKALARLSRKQLKSMVDKQNTYADKNHNH